jgi:hypothetical protein
MTSDRTVAHDDRVLTPSDEAVSTAAASRTDVPVAWDERSQLTTLLDYARATVHAKCAGIAEEEPAGHRCPARR